MFISSRDSPLNLVVLVRLDGRAVYDVLPAALAGLRRRHPLLRARIVGPPTRPRFEISDADTAGSDPIPLRVVRADEVDRVYELAEEDMNAPFDPAVSPLARVTCVSGPGPGTDLILTVHHAIADGASAASLVHELLESCRKGLAGESAPPPVPAPMPPPLTDLLPAGMRGPAGGRKRLTLAAREGRDEVADRLGSRGNRRPIPARGRAVLMPMSLDAAQTATLVSQGRRQRLTLTSLLAAGLLWHVNAVLYEGRPCTMKAVIWVDLRPYLDPPLEADTLGCYVSMLRFPIRVDRRRGLAALATDVQRQVERASRRGDRFPAAQLSAPMARFAARWQVIRLGNVALSHAAAPAIQSDYGPISVREVRAFVSNNRIGAELAAVSGVTHGRLWCDLLYLDSDFGKDVAAALGEGLFAALREFSGAT